MHPQEAAIHDTLAQTLLAGRLAPGSQLVETRLAQIFGVSRETWWKAYLLMIAGVVGIGYLLVEIDKLI